MDAPWPKGTHDSHVGFVIEVHVRRDRDGALTCLRGLQDEVDDLATRVLATGGMEEGAWALLTEAARTEAMLQILVRMSKDAEFKRKMEIDTDDDDQLIDSLSATTMEQIRRELQGIVPEVARETIRILRDGLRRKAG